MELAASYLSVLTGLIAILNPIGAIPAFVSYTEDQTRQERSRTARITAMSALLILLINMAFGQTILQFFGISIASFRVAGGILIMFSGIAMVQARQPRSKHTREEAEEASHKETVAVVPLAIPMIAGPGAISTTILYAEKTKTILGYAKLSSVIFLSCLVIFIVLMTANKISDALGKIGINIVTRVMGLIMMAISVEFITSGLTKLFPSLGS